MKFVKLTLVPMLFLSTVLASVSNASLRNDLYTCTQSRAGGDGYLMVLNIPEKVAAVFSKASGVAPIPAWKLVAPEAALTVLENDSASIRLEDKRPIVWGSTRNCFMIRSATVFRLESISAGTVDATSQRVANIIYRRGFSAANCRAPELAQAPLIPLECRAH